MGILSTLMGKPQQQTTTSTPWGPQADQLKKAFGEASALYDSKKGTSWYGGDLYARMDPLTAQGINGTQGYATGQGAQTAQGVAGASAGLFGAGQGALGLYGQMGQMAGQDPTQMNIANAGQYANNPYMDGMIDAASTDIRRNLSETVMPEIDRAATATGNINSTRAGVASGIAQRGAAETIGNISANLRGSAYQSGLGLSESARMGNMGAMGSAASGMGGMFGHGLQGAGMGMDMAYRNQDALIGAGQLNQADRQGQMDADFTRWQGNDTRAQDLLNNYYSMIGANNWGGTQTAKASGGPGLIQMGIGAASAAAGMGAFSDPRLKVNITLLGRDIDGLGWFTFEYRDDVGFALPEGLQVGVMADEVAELRPYALGPVINGYQTVNYDVL